VGYIRKFLGGKNDRRICKFDTRLQFVCRETPIETSDCCANSGSGDNQFDTFVSILGKNGDPVAAPESSRSKCLG
jgi:hypothetical protein